MSWKHIHLNATDLLWSKVVRERDGWRCRRCGRSRAQGWQVHAAHLVGRRHPVRWMPSAGICLCASCHDWGHRHEAEFKLWARQTVGGEEYDRLYLLSKSTPSRKPDETMTRLALREELRRLTGRVTA